MGRLAHNTPRKTRRQKSAAEVRRNMSAIRSRDNQTEMALRRALHRLGLRYRKYQADLLGCPDIVFPRARVVVFVDGDFWHARILREGGARALTRRLGTPNRAYWLEKFRRRVARDDIVTARLSSDGWRVLRVWEADVAKDIDGAAAKIAKVVRRARAEARYI
jgi:DNA mismatch endonuclease (patch repair protein)